MKHVLIVLTLFLSACNLAQHQDRGYAIAKADFDKIIPGVSNNKDVLELLGSPSSYSSFGEETWLYIGTRRESLAFLKPDVIDQGAVAIVFDQKGTVARIDEYNKDAAEDIAYAEDITPTEGNKITIWQQLLGNLGRFNTAGGGMPGQRTGSGNSDVLN